ncbi:root phototropism protein 3-like [Primulina eburnea]|uniref:root phototropism protein 3-like n=1 Tax=Primulina eburnea TaxID=1245227 RepID=UPI003C6C064E
MWDAEAEFEPDRHHRNEVLSTSNTGVKIDGFVQKGQSWYVATDIPSDLLVQIGDISFHLHKYPFITRSGTMNRIIYKSCGETMNKIVLDDIPGGPGSFELAAKFCYGIAVDLTANNISSLRCAAEYLEMTEDLEEGNLIFKTEAFLNYVVLSSWRDSIIVLKNCEILSPWAGNLQIVRRCSESIAWKACANPKGVKWQYTRKHPRSVSSLKWNETKDSSPSRNTQVPPDWWIEDVSILRIDHFVRVINAIKVKGMRHELIGAAIVQYSAKWLPCTIQENPVSRSGGNGSSSNWKDGLLHMIVSGSRDSIAPSQAKDQRMILESLTSIIPPQRDSVSCSFLLRMLQLANMSNMAPALVTELEKRVGMQLEEAALVDLLIPSYYNKNETVYDVDLVRRLLEHFLVQEQTESSSPNQGSFTEIKILDSARPVSNYNAKMRVAKLVDSYLTEVSRDRNMSLSKFQVLAEALPESSRMCHDGLYRAVDSFLKAHPTMTEHERKRLCRIMDCKKLSVDACMHAAQNERLPIRVVLQVLFSEHVKLSNAVSKNNSKESPEANVYKPLMISNGKTLLEGTPQSFQEDWATAKKDLNTLKFELESVKSQYLELEKNMEMLQRKFDKGSKTKQTTTWTTGWKKLRMLAKMTENNDPRSQVPNEEQAKKATRRWRNSIS